MAGLVILIITIVLGAISYFALALQTLIDDLDDEDDIDTDDEDDWDNFFGY